MNKVKVGFVMPKLTRGGPERCLETFLKYYDKSIIDPVGVFLWGYAKCDKEFLDKLARMCSGRSGYYMLDNIKGKCDVLITHGPQSRDLREFAKRVVYVAHSSAPLDGIYGKEETTTDYVAVARSGLNLFSEGNRAKAKIIYNGVDIVRCCPSDSLKNSKVRFGIEDNDLVIGWAGRDSTDKDPDLMVKAVEILINSYKPSNNKKLKLIMAGGPGLKYSMRSLGSRGVYAGPVEDIGNFYSVLDCLAMTSVTECCPLTLLEAMISNVPVATTYNEFSEDIVKEYGEVISISQDRSPEAVAEAILTAINSPFKEAARDLAWREFNGVRYAKKWSDYICSIA